MAQSFDLDAYLEPHVRALGFELVRVRLGSGEDGRVLQVMAERPETGQLTLDDCSALSRRISDALDTDDPIEGSYRLEVSSPGIDRPLTRRKDFEAWTGHAAKVQFVAPIDDRKSASGELGPVEGDAVRVGATLVPLDNIKSAKLVLTDKLIAATAPLSSEGADEVEETSEKDED